MPFKQWLSALLVGRTRDSHWNAHGQRVPREQAFFVGGHEMMMPGQGPIGETANCLCTTIPGFAEA